MKIKKVQKNFSEPFFDQYIALLELFWMCKLIADAKNKSSQQKYKIKQKNDNHTNDANTKNIS